MSAWASKKLGRRQTQKRRSQKPFRQDATFICGTVKRPLGSNVAVAEKTRVLKRISKKDNALLRHMAWLKELEENRKRLEEEKKAEEERKAERLRLLKRGATETGEKVRNAVSKDADDATTKPKPAWCRTEETNKKAEELANDEQALLDFVDDLNFEQYTEDLELQTLMSQVQSHIKSLQREKKKDETRLQACVDSEKAAERAEIVKSDGSEDLTPANPEPEPEEVDDTQSIAESVMSSDTAIKSIHSRKSIVALVTDAKKRISVKLNPIEEGDCEMPVAPPICITHTDDDGARMAEKKSVNKLAFKHRNPAL